MPSPAFLAIFFCFAAAVLLLFASITPPAWDQYGFLDVSGAAGSGTPAETVFGVFGTCVRGVNCTKPSVGYPLVAQGVSVNLNTSILHNLTFTFILHPIAGGLAFLAFLFGLLGAIAAMRAATLVMTVFAFLAAVCALVVFVIDMVVWNVLHNRLKSAGYTSSLGPANWLTVGACAALLLATCTGIVGSFGRYATGRMGGEKRP